MASLLVFNYVSTSVRGKPPSEVIGVLQRSETSHLFGSSFYRPREADVVGILAFSVLYDGLHAHDDSTVILCSFRSFGTTLYGGAFIFGRVGPLNYYSSQDVFF